MCVRERIWAHLGEDGGVCECVYNWRVLWMVCGGVLREYGLTALCVWTVSILDDGD